MTAQNAPKKVSRRAVLRAGVATAIYAAPMLNFDRFQLFAASTDDTYSGKAIELIKTSLVIDMLCNLASLQQLMSVKYSANPQIGDDSALDAAQIQKLLSMGIDVFHPARGISGHEEVLAFVARLNAYAGQYPQHIRRIDSVDDMDGLKAARKIGYIVGVQNSDHFRTVDDVNLFWNLGQRISQLTYNRQNLIASGSTDRADGGISDFGADIVQRMNEVGMAVDVSHCSDRTTLDACELSKRPVLITHSNARALTAGHPRCKPDEAIKAVARTGGVFGVTGVRNFVRDREPTTIEHVVDHIEYVARLVGIEHVGLGSDMDPDGYDDIEEGLRNKLKASYKGSYGFRDKIDTDGFDHPKRTFDLTERLIRRGYANADIARILGGNFRRVLAQIWKA